MAFHGIFTRMTVMTPSRCFGSLASKQTLVFKNGLPPPSQMRHISMKNPPKLGGNGFGIIGVGAAAGFTLAMVNIAYKKKQADNAYEVSFIQKFFFDRSGFNFLINFRQLDKKHPTKITL